MEARMRVIALLFGVCAVLIAELAPAATPPTSWGKVAVSFTQYRADAEACAEQGLATALQQQLGNWDSAGIHNAPEDYLRTFQSRALAKRHSQITEGQSALDDCLVERGYRQFRLTNAQRAHLDALAAGSDLCWPANAGHTGGVCTSGRRKNSENNWLDCPGPSWMACMRGP
jgi:hypothetical protein